MTDLAADVVGPDVKFHHAKLNVKSGKGTQGFGWHQDIPAWPHTDYSPVTIGIYIDGCTPEQGPLTVAAGSHEGPTVLDVRRRRQFRRQDPRQGSRLAEGRHDPAPDRRAGHDAAAQLPRRARFGAQPGRRRRGPSSCRSIPRPIRFPTRRARSRAPHQGDIVRGTAARFASFDTRPAGDAARLARSATNRFGRTRSRAY